MGARLAPARRAALAVLGDVRRRDARARDVLRASPRLSGLDARDVALAERLVLGVTATRGALDSLLDAHLSRPGSVEPRLRDALRLSAFELCHLSTPAAVAASQGVELARRAAPRAAGLANAVLRKVAERDAPRVCRARAALGPLADDDALDGPLPDDLPGALALAAGWPAWLADELLASVAARPAAAMALCSLDAAPVWVSGDAALHDAGETLGLLRAAGLDPSPSALSGAWRLHSAAGLAASGLVGSGDVVVSDLAARLVALLASPEPGSSVLEVGQGRGTKTLLLEAAALSRGGPARIVGVDSVGYKVRLARERVRRGWDGHVRCLEADARDLAGPVAGLPAPSEEGGSFDLVFVDAPCSGTGTMRRHPETAWDLRPESVDASSPDSLPRLQSQILAACARRVRPGGLLAYSTCSVLEAECGGVVGEFLRGPAGRGFRVLPVDLAARRAGLPPEAASLARAHALPDGTLATRPEAGGPDGHFLALLSREG